QQALLSKALSFGSWWRAEQVKRGRSLADSLPYAPPLDKWISEGAWKSFADTPGSGVPSPDLVVLPGDDPLVAAIGKMRGKPVIIGTRGTATVTKLEVERVRAVA